MGFNPSSFPSIADAGRLRAEAEKFKTKADKVDGLAVDSYGAWSSMPGVYEAPEASTVYGAFAPVKSSGQDLADDAATLKSAINAYADEAESIKSRYESLMVRWHSVEAQKASDDEWQEDEELVKEDNDILSDANALMAEYMAAQRACANTISGIYGGPAYVPTTREGAGPGEVQFGFTGEQLDTAAAEGKLPWGKPSEYDAPWWEDGRNIVASFGKGVWSGVTGTVTGLWNMVNVTDWDTFSTTWKGIGTLAVDSAIMTSPALAMAVGPERTKEAGQRLLAVGKAAVHWDEWQEDPAYAAGATTFDLAAILATAGAGAVTKTGSMASKISTVAGGASKTGTALKVSGVGAVARTTVKVADLATGLKIKSLDLNTSVTRKTLGKLAPVASRLDDGINAMSGPQPALATVGSPGPRPFTDAIDAGISRMDSHSNGSGSGTPAAGSAGPAGRALHGGDTRAPAPTLDGSEADAPAGGSSATDTPDGNRPTPAPAAGASDGGGSGASDGGGSSEAAPTTGTTDGAGADADTPAGGDDADDSGSSDGDGGTGAPKATVTDWNEDGTPKTVTLPNGDKHTVSMSSDQLAQSRVDHEGHQVSSRDVIIQHANERGISASGLEEMIHTPIEELNPDKVQTLVEIRHSIDRSRGDDTIFQKAIPDDRVAGMLDNTAAKDAYRQRIGGFVSDGADTACLRTPQQVIEGLRLDYKFEDGTPGPFTSDDASIHLVRFQTPEGDGIGIPDESARQRLPEGHAYRDIPPLYDPVPGKPHSSNGYTTSEVRGDRIIPEYSTPHRESVRIDEGAEMWRLNRADQEVLVGIYDGKNWVRVA